MVRQNCNIIGQHGKDTDTIRTTSLPPAHRKRSRPRVFSANIRLCLCAQISQLFLFFAPLHPQVTTEGVLEPPPPTGVIVGIFAAHSSLPVLYPGHQDSRHPGPCPAFCTFQPASGLLCRLPCTRAPTSAQQSGHLGTLNCFTIGPEAIFSVGLGFFSSLCRSGVHILQKASH